MVNDDDGSKFNDGIIGLANENWGVGPLLLNYMLDQYVIKKR